MATPDIDLGPMQAQPLPADSFTSRKGLRGWLQGLFGRRRRQFRQNNQERQEALTWLHGGGQQENQ